MKTGTLKLWGAICILLVVAGCKEADVTGPGSTVTRKITGTVYQKVGNVPLDNAIVQNVIGVGGADTTKNGGNFSLSYTISSGLDVKLVATYPGLRNDTASFRLETAADTSVALRLDTTSTPITITPTSGKPSSILVVSNEVNSIAIRGSGLKENTLIVFEVHDSVGNPVLGTNRPLVKFTLLGNTGGGEYLYPTQMQTDPSTGRVFTKLISGTKAGVVQVGAATSGDTVKSGNVRVIIAGGLPHSGHFSLSREKANIAGGLFDNLNARFTVVIGDRYGNPTQPTQVYFTTTGGIITASATTDANGTASAQLTTTNPRPPVAVITATTIGDTTGNASDSVISRQVNLVLSGATAITVPASGFVVPDSGSYTFNYQVADVNGNPLVAGTSIAVTLTGPGAADLEVQGTKEYTMPDVSSPTFTNFTAFIVDKTRGGTGGLFNVVVTVKSQNGDLIKIATGQSTGGTGGGGPVSAGGTPQHVNPVGIPKTALTINDGGDVSGSSTAISFEVTDSAGGRLGPTAFNPNGSVKVVFSAVHFSGGNPGTFTTTVDSTDASGLVQAHFTAGSKSGIVRIFAAVLSNPTTKGFVDVVISGGIPDSNGISYSIDKQNMPGLVKTGALGSVALQMTDQFGNPAKPTDIYFTTDGGNIQAKAQSSASGSVLVSLQGGAPAPFNPSAGQGFVRARLFGKDSVRIEKSIPFMFSGAPLIYGPAGGFTIADSGVYQFNYQVQDANGNPLSGGSTIQVAVSGPGSSTLEVTGGSITLPDTRDTNFTNFSATISDKVLGGGSGGVTITITTSGDNGTASYSFSGTLISSASGGGTGGGGFASSIELVNVSKTSVSVRGTGAPETAFLTWVLKDSNGVAISQSKADTVDFTINGGPGGGEFMSPTSSISDATGKVSATFNSGTKAGVVQVQATATIGSRTISSGPISITIFGGLPDSTRMSVSSSAANYFPGSGGSIGSVNVQLGDKYNNPVQPGTAVYFTTTGGLIDASGYTDAAGHTSATLYGGNPFPPGGIDTITVRTVGANGASIVKRHIVTFSSATTILGPANGFSIQDSGSYTFNFQVQDANGNPLTAGSTLQLSLSGSGSSPLEFSTGQPAALIDTRDTNYTNFSATVRDNTLGGASGPVTITISVVSPNGNATYAFTGSLLSAGVSGGGGGTNGIPKFVNVVSTSRTDLNVYEGGSTSASSSVVTFEVIDSSGTRLGSNALGGSNNIKVAFSSVFNPTGGSTGTFTTTLDSTDAQGLVRAQFKAGNKAGVVRIWAKTQTVPVVAGFAEVIISGGFPDSNRVSIQLDKLNLAPGGTGTVSMQVADQFGNPAKTSSVYFTSDGGSIQPSASTDGAGRLSVSLFGGTPVPSNPTPGRGFVTAYMFGRDSIRIQKRVPFLFSGAPSVLMPAGGFQIPDSGTYPVNFQVQDTSGNPMAAGSLVSVQASGAGSSELLITPNSFLISDTRDTNATNFSVLLSDPKMGGPSGQINLTVSVTGPNGTNSGTISGTQLVTGTIGGTNGGGSGYAATIRAVRTSIDPSKSLSIKQGGGTETAQITFQVLDTLGNPIDLNHKDTVTFTLQNGPGGGEFVTPASAITDPTGLVVTSISSGTKAGIVQVVASLTAGAVTITSNPVQMSIESGAPDSNHITVFVQDATHFIRSNLPGLATAGQLGFVRTLMADKYGNPAKNRLVRFYTNGGFIDPSQISNEAGVAEVQIYGGNPNPSGGADTVTIETLGENGVLIRKKAVLTFSGSPVITTTNVPANDTVTVFDGGFTDVNYKVLDANGNPVAANNAITVNVSGTVSGQISTTSDVFVTTIDTRNALDGNFKVRLSDASPGGGTSGDFTITISTSGPNGTSNRRFYGHLNAPSAINPPSPTAKNPAQIAFLGVSNTDISVAGTGANENTVLTYEVRDSLGSAVDKDHRAIAHFTLQFFPNSFAASGTSPHLIPNLDSTDEQGKLRVSLVSGTTSGVVQVVTTVNLPGGAQLKTSPVRINVNAGFPDQRHFTLAGEKHNFPGLDKSFVTMDYTVGVSDKYSNPVQSGTSVYWHSTHGTMQTATSSTDINGFVTKKLFSANPLPTGSDSLSLGQGWGKVYAQTFGDSANAIIDSFAVLWTGAPVTVKTSGVSVFAIADGGSAGPWTFRVTDRLGHPLSSGTQITVTATEGSVDGDANNTLFDTTVGGSGITTFTVILSDADIGDANPPKNCILKVSVVHPVYGTYQTILATGTVD